MRAVHRSLGFGVVLAVQAIFALRYAGSALGTPAGVIAAIGATAATAMVPVVVGRLPARLLTGRLYVAALAVASALAIVCWVLVDPESIDVDRWSAITGFWDALRDGRFPYEGRSHIGNNSGQFPFFFWLVGPISVAPDGGVLPLGTVLATAWWVWRRADPDRRAAFTVLALLLTNLAVWWEIVVRSNLFFNAALCLPIVIALVCTPPVAPARAAWWGAASGLVLSTRSIVAVPLVAAASSAFVWRRRWALAVVFGLAALGAFVATFVPLLPWGLDALSGPDSPFEFQSVFVPAPALAFGMALCVVWAGRADDDRTAGARVAVLVAALSAVFLVGDLLEEGRGSFYGGGAEISYLCLALPFAVLALTPIGSRSRAT